MNKMRKKEKKDDVLQHILEYMKRLEGQSFDFDKRKTEEQYRNAYKKHKKACEIILSKVKGNVIPLGEEIPPEQDTLIKVDKPDYLLDKKKNYTLFDVKYKSKEDYFGWINVRAYLTYKQCSDDLGIPLYVISTDLNKIGYFSIKEEPFEREKEAWDGNLVHIFRWRVGLPF